jgi:hypothetical protein
VPGADVRLTDGFELPFASAAFDVVTASLVMSSVESSLSKQRLITEMMRITRLGGITIVYDFIVSKPWSATVAPLSTRDLARLVGQPAMVIHAAPFLPLLEVALRLPPALRGVIRMLPRTHRVWVWNVGSSTVDLEHHGP